MLTAKTRLGENVAIVGSLCDLDLAFADLLIRNGVAVRVIRTEKDPKPFFNRLVSAPKHLKEQNIQQVRSGLNFYRELRKYERIISICGAVMTGLGKGWRLADKAFANKKIISIGTGSDLAELAIQSDAPGKAYRRV